MGRHSSMAFRVFRVLVGNLQFQGRETSDGWANVLTGSEGRWMVRVLRNNSPVEMRGCTHGYCSLPAFRQVFPGTDSRSRQKSFVRDRRCGCLL